DDAGHRYHSRHQRRADAGGRCRRGDEDATAAAATAAAGVLANDTDPDHGETATLTVSSIQSASVNGAPLTWLTNGTATVDGAYGTLTINSDGTYSYTPNNAAAEALAQDE